MLLLTYYSDNEKTVLKSRWNDLGEELYSNNAHIYSTENYERQ